MKSIQEIYEEMLACFTQETGMALAGTGETAVRLYALAAQVYGLYEEAAWTRRQCFPRRPAGNFWSTMPSCGGWSAGGRCGPRGPCGFS